MKGWGLLALVGVVLPIVAGSGAFGVAREPEEPITLVVGGDLKGYLSPCGCTKPMTGGVLRRGRAIQELRRSGKIILLENTGWVADNGEQSRLKFQAIAEMLDQMKVDAVHFGPSEFKVGLEEAVSASNLLGDRMLGIGTSEVPMERSREVHGYWLTTDPDAEAGGYPVILLDGNLAKAKEVAKGLERGVIVYRSTGDALLPESLGSVHLVTPGENGKGLVALTMRGQQLVEAKVVKLTPEYEDDPAVGRLYRRYLDRVDSEKLLDRVPKTPSDPFAGSAACMSCHQDAGHTWLESRHAQAFATLEKEGHDRDPECVPCHVVGLDRKGGFTGPKETPALANVGCESCHGPGGNHAIDPYKFKLPKVGEASCVPCHKPEHSPGFDFPTYWKRIAH